MSASEKIQKVNLTQKVFEYIQEKIENGTWSEGEKIESELEMSEKLGVSRVTVRNAVHQLVALGKLDSIQGKGTFVRHSGQLYFPKYAFSAKDQVNIMHIMQVRITIEGDAAYFAAKYAKEADLLFLQENVARMLEVDRANDYVSSWDFDMQFHLKIAEMSRNPYYYTILNQILEESYDTLLNLISKIGVRYAKHFHPGILKALTQGDSALAKEAIQSHLRDFILQINERS